MESNSRISVYIANAMFSEADRLFNLQIQETMERYGILVYLPQNNSENTRDDPCNIVIFEQDTYQILQADIIVACLDQDTIDSGVACEIGIAVTLGKPIVGILTDIRQHRTKNRIYKNPFVTGAIERSGIIVKSIEEAVKAIQIYKQKKQIIKENRKAHYSTVANEYNDGVRAVEAMYDKPLDIYGIIEKMLIPARKYWIADIGCGPSQIGDRLTSLPNVNSYVGIDTSKEIIASQNSIAHNPNVHYCEMKSWHEWFYQPNDVNFVLILFTLHDVIDKFGLFHEITKDAPIGTEFLIIDISTDDLPHLIQGFTEKTDSVINKGSDSRISPTLLSEIAARYQLTVQNIQYINTKIVFRSTDDIVHFITQFGINLGMDLPMSSPYINPDKFSEQLLHTARNTPVPFYDWRSFVICKLVKEC